MDAGGNLCGGESIYAGNRLVDRIRTAAYGHTIGKDIGLAYLPWEFAKARTMLDVEILGDRVKAEVAELPLVDPTGMKIKA
jgi:glycine cleavage system aminomethyltransferase T